MPKLSDQVMVSAPGGGGKGEGERGRRKGEVGKGRGKWGGGKGEGERGRGKGGGGKGEGEGRGGKGERGKGEGRSRQDTRRGEEERRHTCQCHPSDSRNAALAYIVCPASHRVAVAAAILCMCVIYTIRLPLNTHVKKIYFNQTTHSHPRLKHRLFTPNFSTIYYGKPCCLEGFLCPPCASFPDLPEILKRGSDKRGEVEVYTVNC